MSVDWQTTSAAVWRPKQGRLRAVKRTDAIGFHALLGIDRQKAEFCANLEQFLDGRPANNILLWGSRGTGKSSLVKAALNEYRDRGLRVVEIDKDDLSDLPWETRAKRPGSTGPCSMWTLCAPIIAPWRPPPRKNTARFLRPPRHRDCKRRHAPRLRPPRPSGHHRPSPRLPEPCFW